MKKIVWMFLCCMALSVSAWSQIRGAVHFFGNAEKYRLNKQYKEAIQEYDLSLAISDTASVTHYWKGVCLFMLKETEQAIGCWEQAVILNPSYTLAYDALARGYRAKGNQEKMFQALEQMAAAETDAKRKADAYMQIASLHAEQSRWESAALAAEKACKANPKDAEVQFAYATMANKAGRSAAAVPVLQGYLAGRYKNGTPANEQDARWHLELAAAYFHTQQYEKAAEVAKRLELTPLKLQAYKYTAAYFYDAASTYAACYELEPARELLRKALAIDKTLSKANLLLADLKMREEGAPKGINLYKQAIDSDPGNDKALDEMYPKYMDLLLLSGQYAEAEKVGAKRSSSKEVLFLRAIALHKNKKDAEALSLLRMAVSQPQVTTAERSLWYFAMGLFTSAKEAGKALELLAQAKRGPHAPAAEYYSDVLSSLPKEPRSM